MLSTPLGDFRAERDAAEIASRERPRGFGDGTNAELKRSRAPPNTVTPPKANRDLESRDHLSIAYPLHFCQI
jgi:hypothetical protein